MVRIAPYKIMKNPNFLLWVFLGCSEMSINLAIFSILTIWARTDVVIDSECPVYWDNLFSEFLSSDDFLYCLLYRNEKAMVKRDSDFWLSWLVYDGINVLIRISVKKSPNICNLFPKSYVKFRQKIKNSIFATQILRINGLSARLLLSLVQKTRVWDT